MSTLDDREKGFERKFVSEQEREFRAQTRAARMLGEWAARKMGLENVNEYVQAVVRSEVAHGGEQDVLRKVTQDLAGAGIETRETEVHSKLDEYLALAREEVRAAG